METSVKKGVAAPLKKMQDLTKEEIKLLPTFRCLFAIEKRRNSVSDSYVAKITIGDLNPTIYLSEAKYIKISRALGYASVEKKMSADVYCRLTKGKRKDDSEYYLVEVSLSKKMYESFFLDDDQVDCINYDPSISKLFVERPDSVDPTATTTLIDKD